MPGRLSRPYPRLWGARGVAGRTWPRLAEKTHPSWKRLSPGYTILSNRCYYLLSARECYGRWILLFYLGHVRSPRDPDPSPITIAPCPGFGKLLAFAGGSARPAFPSLRRVAVLLGLALCLAGLPAAAQVRMLVDDN